MMAIPKKFVTIGKNKPRITKLPNVWKCHGAGITMYGYTPDAAYRNWRNAAEYREMLRKRPWSCA